MIAENAGLCACACACVSLCASVSVSVCECERVCWNSWRVLEYSCSPVATLELPLTFCFSSPVTQTAITDAAIENKASYKVAIGVL